METDHAHESTTRPVEQTLEGIAVSPGIAIALPYLFTTPTLDFHAENQERISLETSEAHSVAVERQRFQEALTRSEYELGKIALVATEKMGYANAALFEAQMLILQDIAFQDAVCELIQDNKVSAEKAVQIVMERYIVAISGSTHLYLRERSQDLNDVKDRILRNLQHKRLHSKITENCIVIAESLTAADIVLFSQRNIKGCIMSVGGATSHTAIMARALGIPIVVAMGWEIKHIQAQSQIVLDGYTGEVILHPDVKTVQSYERKIAYIEKRKAEFHTLRLEKAITQDGCEVTLQANIEVEQELPLLQENQAEGIGLLRTEMNFLMQGRLLDEEEQFLFYKDILEAAHPQPVTIRLLDLGSDKALPSAQREANPALGWRGVRMLLDRPEWLSTQLRAILRASAFGKTRILIPMITAVSEVRAVRRFKAKIEQELREANVAFDAHIPLGIMVEVPAVALLIESFLPETDFISIGTNDLTQYTLAIDRNNDLVAFQYDELHPAVLQLVAHICTVAEKMSIPVSVCGEIIANPLAVAIFLGLGITSMSASPVFLPDMKRMIRSIQRSDAEDWARDALQQSDARVLRKRILKAMREKGIDTDQFLSLGSS